MNYSCWWCLIGSGGIHRGGTESGATTFRVKKDRALPFFRMNVVSGRQLLKRIVHKSTLTVPRSILLACFFFFFGHASHLKSFLHANVEAL